MKLGSFETRRQTVTMQGIWHANCKTLTLRSTVIQLQTSRSETSWMATGSSLRTSMGKVLLSPDGSCEYGVNFSIALITCFAAVAKTITRLLSSLAPALSASHIVKLIADQSQVGTDDGD